MKTYNDICISRGKVLVIHVFAGILMALCFGLIFGYFIMLLWNSLLPDILGLKEITYWQGTGLVIMFRLLFGSHGYHKQGQPFKKYQTHRVSQQYQGSSTRRDYYQAWWQTEGAEALRKYIENQDRCSK